MGYRTWMKYLGIAAAFAGIGGRLVSWLTMAQSAGSPDGDDIVPEEIVQIQGVITDAINEGLRQAEVPIVASVTLTYVGDEP